MGSWEGMAKQVLESVMKKDTTKKGTDGTWLDYEWYELCDTVYRFKQFLRKRGIVVVERAGFNGGSLRTEGEFRITIRRDASDGAKLVYLIHEFVHIELGHRDAGNNSVYPAEEVEACLVSHIVNGIFYLTIIPTDYIYQHSYWISGVYSKAYQIATQLREDVFEEGELPSNHKTLLAQSGRG